MSEQMQQADMPEQHVWRQAWSWLWFVIGLAIVVLIGIFSIAMGSVSIPPLTTFRIIAAQIVSTPIVPDWAPSTAAIVLDIRLPRVLLIAITGAALASSGVAYQGIFRNPLADPYLIGVAAGAGFGAICMVVLRMRYPMLIGQFSLPIGAFVGALVTVAIVYVLGRVGTSTPTSTLLLAGVALSTLATSLSTFVLMRAGQQLGLVTAFLLGSYTSTGWAPVTITWPIMAVGFVILMVMARSLNLLLFDEEQARQLGVAVERAKFIVIITATLITAAAVAFSGPIGFVGLIVPHSVRLVAGGDNRRLLPLSALGGASFLMLADLLSRVLVAPEELPLGVVTALAGVPFFLVLLRRAKNAAFF